MQQIVIRRSMHNSFQYHAWISVKNPSVFGFWANHFIYMPAFVKLRHFSFPYAGLSHLLDMHSYQLEVDFYPIFLLQLHCGGYGNLDDALW